MPLGIGKQPYWWFPLFFITILFTYTICILPTQLADIVWLSVVTSAGVTVFVYFMSLWFLYEIVIVGDYTEYTNLGMFLGVVEVVLSLIHALALIMYSIAISRTGDFSTITTETGYELYWTYCIANTVGYFFSAGVVNSTGVSALGVFHNVLTILTGSFVLLIALALAVSRLRIRRRIIKK